MKKVYIDYNITQDSLTSTAELPGKLQLITFSCAVIIINILATYFIYTDILGIQKLVNRISFSILFSLIVFGLGLIGGRIWQKFGIIGAKATYLPYVEVPEQLSMLSRIYIKLLESDSDIFLEGRSKDQRLKGPISVLPLIFRVSLSQMGFFITITALIINPIKKGIRPDFPFFAYVNIVAIIFTLGLSVLILALYLPMSIILFDSNLRTFNQNTRFVGVPGAKFRSRLDSFVGIGALSTGWSIFGEVRDTSINGFFLFNGNSTLFITLDYLSWLVFILILSWPLIAPASIYYFRNLSKTINIFRSEAIQKGVPIGVSHIRQPDEKETSEIQSFISDTKE
ncbi:MAG: hypothetical protein OEY49_05590 [Candidatus Heimdallarchaeota archaeon]|nr:hypothetical protein [Candidatus Heimdallarchaeota archaeon]